MPASFKGTNIALSNIRLAGQGSSGTVVNFDVQFRDGEGVVHAATSHSIEVPEEGAIRQGALLLVQGLKEWTEQVHFNDPTASRTETKKRLRGIAENLPQQSDPSDEFEEQG